MFSFMKIWKEQEEIINVPTIMPTVTLTSTEISKQYNIDKATIKDARKNNRLKYVGTFPHPSQKNVTAYLYDPKDVENWRASVKSYKKKKNKVIEQKKLINWLASMFVLVVGLILKMLSRFILLYK